MLKPFILARLPPCPNILLWGMGALLFFPFSLTQGMGNTMEEEIETLDVIEITGTVVEQAPRDLNFPLPEFQTQLHHLEIIEHLSRPDWKLIMQIPIPSRILLDQTAKSRNLHTPVKPLKTIHPLYPRQARDRDWQGQVILRFKILSNGTVESGTIHQSSGYQMLDDSALKAVKQWQFQPAKNGGFPVVSVVDIPIKFDLAKETRLDGPKRTDR